MSNNFETNNAIDNKKILLTSEGLAHIKAELSNLVNVTRNQVIKEIQEARAQGDLSENADYDAARNRQAQVESRIKELETQVDNAQIIDQKHIGNKVQVGAIVTLKNLKTNKEHEYTIVGSVEADPFANKISNESPIAKAIMGATKNDVILVKNIESPYKVKIINIKSK